MGASPSSFQTIPPSWKLVYVSAPFSIYREADGFLFSGKYALLCEPLGHPADGGTDRYLVLVKEQDTIEDAREVLAALEPFTRLPSMTRTRLVRLQTVLAKAPTLPPLCALAYCSYSDALGQALGMLGPPYQDGQGKSALLYAIAPLDHGPSLACVQALLAHPATRHLVNTRNSTGDSPLHVAATLAHADRGALVALVQALLTAGADPSARNEAGLASVHVAVEHDNVVAFQELASRGGRGLEAHGLTCLHLAARRPALKCLAHMLTATPAAADINRVAPAQAMGHGGTPLHLAVRSDHTEAVRLLLTHGADPACMDQTGSTVLHVAAASGSKSTAAIEAVLARVPGLLAVPNSKGLLPLQLALTKENASFLEMVYKCGPRVYQHANLAAGTPPMLTRSDCDGACRRWILEIYLGQLQHGDQMPALPQPPATAVAAAAAAPAPPRTPTPVRASAGAAAADGTGAGARAERITALEREVETYKAMLTCGVCMGTPVQIAFAPCGHVCACRECAQMLTACPLCRAQITSRLHIYVST